MPLAAAPYRASGLVQWHETDMPTASRKVRYQGQSGKHLLALSFSGFDPIRTLPRQRLLELHLHNCDAFVRKRRACRIPNGSSRRASLR